MNTIEIESMLAPTPLDRAIGRVFPGWGARRLVQRREFAYEAARNTRLRNSAARLQGPEDFTAFPDRLQLIRQMRDLVQNFGLFQSIQRKLAMYAFGRIRYQALTGDRATNEAYEQNLAERFAALDISGRHNLRQIVSIAFMSQLNDGDFLLKWQRGGDGSLRLVGIEGDRLGGIVMGSPLENYFQGITVDVETGAPVSYRVYHRSKANAYTNPVELPASDCLLYLDPTRIDQYRGITPFAPVINEARDLKELMEAVRIGTKFENYHAAVGYTPNGLPLQEPADFITSSGAMANGQAMTEQEIKPGLIQWAPNSSKVEFLKSDRPSGQFQSYLENLIHLIANALCLPYGFVYKLSGLAGPSVRMDAQQAHRTIQFHQQNMIERVLDQVKNTLLVEEFGAGRLRYNPRWAQGRWQFAPSITIDAGRDSKAMIDEWKAGLKTKATIFAEDGFDAEEQEEIYETEVARTLDRAKLLAQSKDVPLELALTMLEVRTPNGFIPRNAPQQEVNDDGSVETMTPPEPAQQSSELTLARKRTPRDELRAEIMRGKALRAIKESVPLRRARLLSEPDALAWLMHEPAQRVPALATTPDEVTDASLVQMHEKQLRNLCQSMQQRETMLREKLADQRGRLSPDSRRELNAEIERASVRMPALASLAPGASLAETHDAVLRQLEASIETNDQSTLQRLRAHRGTMSRSEREKLRADILDPARGVKLPALPDEN